MTVALLVFFNLLGSKESWFVPQGIRQNQPQLDAVQEPCGGGDLRVGDPRTGIHHIDGAWHHGCFHAGRIVVLNLPVEEPAHGLQAGVRVGWYGHSTCVGDIIGPVMVDEAPGPDGCPTPVGKGPTNRHCPKATEWDIPSGRYFERARVCNLEGGGRPGFRIPPAHRVRITAHAGGEHWPIARICQLLS